ncbi:hypothetical protein ANCDUO_00125 [Ancylostoma duodenale]|uniref:Uncharacterized protein n=1 Tax=Ancylostoma duodenale TaxID=51022 RepID=A0A0C2H6M3_9BILA|nr:hypothetical protein ANCDUO_00125 [Ancylostoma duodenale]
MRHGTTKTKTEAEEVMAGTITVRRGILTGAAWRICGERDGTGEWQSLNDYDGNKANIVPDRARKYWQAVRVSASGLAIGKAKFLKSCRALSSMARKYIARRSEASGHPPRPGA